MTLFLISIKMQINTKIFKISIREKQTEPNESPSRHKDE